MASLLLRYIGPACVQGFSRLQQGLLTRSQPSFRPPLALMWASPQVDLRSTGHFHGLQRHSLTHHALHQVLQGNACSCTRGIFCSSFILTLVSAQLISLTHSHSSLLWLQSSSAQWLFSFLNVLTQKHYCHHWWIQPQPVAGSSWSRLEYFHWT